jgi:pimeloyl-ACP methyl ester carboxylesterase
MVLLGAGAMSLGWVLARKLTSAVGSRTFDLRLRDIETDGDRRLLILDRTRSTAAPGIFSLWFETGEWVRVSDEVIDRGPGQIARVVTHAASDRLPSLGASFSWSGIYFDSPAAAGLSVREVFVTTPAGPAPAWLADGEHRAATWAIHVHGMGGRRRGTLRGVQVTAELGWTSLVVSFRNDGEGPSVEKGRSTLGYSEADDVEAAVDYAVKQGAERIVLFGWSLGAAIALRVADRMRSAGVITALVLDSPVLSWIEVIEANCVRSGLPAVAGRLSLPWLTLDPLARIAGLPGAVSLREMDWIERARELTVPTLILHGDRDDSVPPAVSQALRDRRPGFVELVAFEAGHSLAWNSDPERWRSSVSAWLSTAVFD